MAGRRANGEGSIKQLPSGRWCAQVMDGQKLDGSRNLVYFSGTTKQDVVGQMREYWKRRELGAAPSRQVSFAEWADIWYQDYQSQVQPSTYAGYHYTLKILKDYFGQRQIQQIRPLEIGGFYDYLHGAGYSRSYQTKCRSMMIQIFDAAEANEITSSNPARKAKIRRVLPGLVVTETCSKDAFTEEECAYLAQYLRSDLLGNSILLMIGTGLRTQELLALTKEDIAPDGSFLHVNKAIKLVNGVPTLGPPKSARGRRTIPVPTSFRKYAMYLYYFGGPSYIWTSQRENCLFDPGVFRKQYYKAIAEIPQVRKLSPHCCRHTYISMLERRGTPMEQIARLAGHSKIATTDGYLHVDLTTLSRTVEVLDLPEQHTGSHVS